MSIPAEVEAVLADLEYSEFETLGEFGPMGDAITTLMQDSKGNPFQIIYPRNSIVDVEALERFTGLVLSACPSEKIQAILDQYQIERLPTLPNVIAATCILDQQLLESDVLKLDCGQGKSLIHLSRDAFQQLTARIDVRQGNIAVNLTTLGSGSLDSALDLDDISNAVAGFTQRRIKQRLEETLEFPPLPETAQQIIKLRADPEANIQQLARIVDTDPSLAAQVVSWAASPYYAAPGKIQSVHDAIMRVLGFDLVLNLSVGLALDKMLSLPKDCAKGFTPYWQQAVYAATAVEALVGSIDAKHRPAMGLAYLAGLLQNFGYLMLAQIFPPHFSSICRYQEANPQASHCFIERHLLGVTREQMSAWLMKSWGLPEEVCTALRFQNEPAYGGEHSAYAKLLFVAMRMLRKHGIGDAPLEPIPEALFEELHIDRKQAELLIAQIMESSEDLEAMAAQMAA